MTTHDRHTCQPIVIEGTGPIPQRDKAVVRKAVIPLNIAVWRSYPVSVSHRRLPILPSRRPKATFGGMMAATNLFERSPFARVMADVPVTVYDVGARGGVDLDLLPLAFAVDAVAFEPHPEEYKRLVDGVTGFLTGFDAAQIAARITQVVTDRPLRDTLAANARAMAEAEYANGVFARTLDGEWRRNWDEGVEGA